MEFRQLGGSGFKVPVLSFGTGSFGGTNEFFKGFGQSDVEEATRLVDVCLEHGLNMFDSAGRRGRRNPWSSHQGPQGPSHHLD